MNTGKMGDIVCYENIIFRDSGSSNHHIHGTNQVALCFKFIS